ncbi:hypothetical protein ACQ4M3_39105 [Leptolyngbya sp. AN03gr2]|uniref:hypothetical protein n=1 Tax=unclassified Leptolyngbya TaxID=2650499 RepID=UPI003D31F995
MPKQKNIYLAALILSIVLATQLTLTQLHVRGILSVESLLPLIRRRFITLEFIALCGLYLFWLIRYRPDKSASRYLELLKPASLFLIPAWIAHPLTSDIHLYFQYGLMSLYRVNPYLTNAVDFESVMSTFLDWTQTSTYGVVSLFIFAIPAKFVETNVYLGVYIFKLICVFFHILNGYLIWRALKATSYRHKVTLAYLLSPIVLFEHVIEAHLDVILCTVLIAIDQLFKTRRYLLGLIAAGVGFLTKTLPIIWIPLLGVFLIRERRWKTIVKFTLICAIAVLVLSLTVFPTIATWISVFNPGVDGLTAGSWHALVRGILVRTQGTLHSAKQWIVPGSTQALIWTLFNRFTLLLFAAFYGLTLYRIYRNRGILESQLMVKIGWVTFVLFAFATAWYQPWYATILLPIAALNLQQAPFFAILSFVFAMVSSITNLALGYGTNLAGLLAAVLTMGSAIVMLLMRSRIMAWIESESPRETGRVLQEMKQ